MDATIANSREDASSEAFDWLAVIEGGAVSPRERAAFEAWLDEHPNNRAAYEEAQLTRERLLRSPALRALADDVDRELAESQNSTPQLFGGLAGVRPIHGVAALAATLLLAIAATVVMQRAMRSGEVYATQTAQAETIDLADGSQVDLAPASKIRVRYSDDIRRVALLTGEAFFDVSKDARRPFIVEADGVVTRVVGTRFNVHKGPEGVTVAVEEGQVQVRQESPFGLPALLDGAPGNQREQYLSAGELVTAAAKTGVAAPVEVSADRAGAWRSGFLVYRDNTLQAVVADLNRYSSAKIEIASDDLNDLRLMAAFKTENIGEMLDGLEELLPVEIDRADPDRVIIRPRISG